MLIFFEQYPEYKQVFKVKRISYAGGRKIVSSADKDSIIKESSLYKESIQMLKAIISPRLAEIRDTYGSDIVDSRSLFSGMNQSSYDTQSYNSDTALDFMGFSEEEFSDE